MRLNLIPKTAACLFLSLTLSNAYSADPLLDQAASLMASGTTLIDDPAKGGEELEVAMKEALSNFNKLNWTQILPVNDLIMIENAQGEHILIDSEARIAIRGDFEIYDLWNKRTVNSQFAAKSMWLVSLDSFNIKPGDLASFRYGLDKPKADVTVLIDPMGDFNQKIFDQMKLMAGDYSFEIVLTPLMGEQSTFNAIKLWCSRDREKSLKQLMDGEEPTGSLFVTCDKSPVIKALGVASLLHIKGLPHLVRQDGLQLAGAPDDLKEFMERNVDSIGEVKTDEAK